MEKARRTRGISKRASWVVHWPQEGLTQAGVVSALCRHALVKLGELAALAPRAGRGSLGTPTFMKLVGYTLAGTKKGNPTPDPSSNVISKNRQLMCGPGFTNLTLKFTLKHLP